MTQNKSKFGNITKKIDNLPNPQSAIAQRHFVNESIPVSTTDNNSPETNSDNPRYLKLSENTVEKFYEFKGISNIIEALKRKGYLVSLEDEKRIFNYVLKNPLAEGMIPSLYYEDIISKFKLSKDYQPPITSKLFLESNLTANSSSLVMDTMFSLMIGKGLNIFQISKRLCRGSKRFTDIGDINIIFRDIGFDLVSQYGEDTYQVFSLLLAYWYKNKPQNWGETITLSGDKILEILNEKNKVIRDKNKVKRLSKIEGLNWVAHHCELLKGIRVYASKIIPNGRGKTKFAFEETPLIEFSKIIYYPIGIEDNHPLFDNIEDLHISFKVGGWFNFFDDEKYFKQFGYTHREAFSSSGLVSALLHWLNIKLEQNQRGEFKIRTIVDQIGLLKDKLKAIYCETDSKKVSNLKLDLFRFLMSALTEIKEGIKDPYQWDFKNAPQWLLDNSKKPIGWFDGWLDVVIVFKHPECLIPEGKAYRREKIKEVNPEPKPEKIKTTEDLKYVMDKFKISIRELVKKSDNKITYYKLQKSLKENSLKDSEVRELMNYCYRINQSRKK